MCKVTTTFDKQQCGVLEGSLAKSSLCESERRYSKYSGAADAREATLEVVLTEQQEAIRLETRDTENHTTSGRIAVETATLGHRDVYQASEEKLQCPVRLRLTASQPHQVSSIWYAQQLPILQGFETRFTFQITDQSRRCFEVKDQNFGLHEYQSCAVHGGDGLAFVIHSHQNRTATIGEQGSRMGFAGLQNSLAIEFDTWFNDETAGEDVFYDHVAIYSRGQNSNADVEYARISAAAVHDLADGKVHIVKIRYYPELKGFTASTSSSWQKHDVLGWYYCTEVLTYLHRGQPYLAFTNVLGRIFFFLQPPCLDQYDTEMPFDFDYNEQSMLSTASHGNTLYPIFIYPDTVSWAKRQAYFAANQKVGLVS
ncbi:unnamed protein product [Phytophthora lilii]|uniref:Unnamed protein product n=1 Tax=Phytophthora lilii TaxID=2077276 RepID=A0A9W6U3A5_9STRA|nr:unnamed protein product [Phytophthora lilii]